MIILYSYFLVDLLTNGSAPDISDNYTITLTLLWFSFEGIIMAKLSSDKWINLDEAAEYIGVKPEAVWDRFRKKKDILLKEKLC